MTKLNPDLNLWPQAGRISPISLKNSHVHLVGVGGVAMTALAGLLSESGVAHQVTGSDEGVYPPMSDLLSDMGITVAQGYGPETLPPECDLVVVGNVVSSHFPVLTAMNDLKKPYLSLPQTLGEIFMSHTKNLVVAGCHGKTTTTAMAAKIWSQAGLEPGFLIGGVSLDFPRPWRAGQGEWFIIEGDEYDSAFFNKVPKFMHYRPHTVILTSVEFDHADIYPDLEAVLQAYTNLMKIIPSSGPEPGRLVAWGDDPLVQQVAQACPAEVEFYGFGEQNDWILTGYEEQGFSSSFELSGPDGFYIRLSLPHPGVYNALNAAAAAAAYVGAGYDGRHLSQALADFCGVKRRQEILGDFKGITLIDDFAHHPTAVAKTIAALKGAFPRRRLLVAFEPRSNTSQRAVFQQQYAQALAGADQVFIRQPPALHKAPTDDRLDAHHLCRELEGASLYEHGRDLGQALVSQAQAGDVVVVMSNGGFDGLISFLQEQWGGIPQITKG